MTKGQIFLKKHSSTILTIIGSIGVVGTTVLAVKATPKALKLIALAENEKGDDLTPVETVKAAWKPYIPSIITGTATIACIFGIHVLSARNQASLMSAYAVLDNTYKEYRKKVKEMYKDVDGPSVEEEIVKAKERPSLYGDKTLFFDFQSLRHFESTLEDVFEAENILNQDFVENGYSCLNQYYDILCIPRVDYGYELGWSTANIKELKFEYQKTIMEDGLECWIITMPQPPEADYLYQVR